MDRVVTLSCSGAPGPSGCPAQHALRLICQTCFAVPGRPQMQPVRLLVPAEQVFPFAFIQFPPQIPTSYGSLHSMAVYACNWAVT